MGYLEILKDKRDYYGEVPAIYEFAAEEYATRMAIKENKSILEMARMHMDSRAIFVLENRINELTNIIK